LARKTKSRRQPPRPKNHHRRLAGEVSIACPSVAYEKQFDKAVIVASDGDLMYAIRFLKENFQKECFVFGARDHIGREIFDCKKEGIIKDVFYAEDFEYRLNKDRFRQ